MRVAILSLFLLFAPALSAYGQDCKNVIFAAPENTLVVFMHSSDKTTQLTEIREGSGRLCDAEWSFGLAAYLVKCGNENYALRSVTETGHVTYDGVTLQRQCAN